MPLPTSTAISIRLAMPSEREPLEALQNRASLANAGDRDFILAHPNANEVSIRQIESGQVYVAELRRSIVGFAAVLARDDGDADLDALFVEPGLWRQGIGRRLVACCEDAARALGASALRVIGNPHAAGFYHSIGFKNIGVSATRFGEGILYRKALN